MILGWITNLIAGELWNDKIKDVIDKADFFLACLSKESVAKRGYIQKGFKSALELWEYKLSSDIFIIPIRLNDCEIPQDFKFHWIDNGLSYKTFLSLPGPYGASNNFEHNDYQLASIVSAIEEGVKRRSK